MKRFSKRKESKVTAKTHRRHNKEEIAKHEIKKISGDIPLNKPEDFIYRNP